MGKSIIETKNKVRQALVTQVTAGTGITVDSTPSKGVFVTKFTVPSTAQAVASAALAFGKLLGTFPKCSIFIHAVGLDITYVADGACTVQADIGVGTLIGSGAQTVLSGVGATAEDCLDGQTATAFNGTTGVNYEIAKVGEVDIKDGTTTAKSLYLNFAGNWATTVGLTYSGVVTVIWSKLQ